jgi:hypothetical protein
MFQSGMAADAYVNKQTMSIRDNVPGSMDQRGATMDSTWSLALLSDATLGSWFSRPIQIRNLQWDVDTPIYSRFNPWTLFWENARNIEKIKNYHLLQGKLHVKILINGNAFYYGRAIAAYEPLSPLDSISPLRTWVPEDFIRGSQRMHIYVNPTTSSGGSLELPFFYNKNNWVVAGKQWQDMGEIVIASLNDLKHANGSTDPLNITVLAWAEDVQFAIPTRSVPESGTEGGDEHEKDVISRPASNVARVAGALSDVPVIGPYAKATQIGAKAVASAAKMFGLSAPNELHQSIYEPRAKHSLAVTDTKQSANKLTIDSKQELTLDPRTTGIYGDDELPIASIAGRESYLTTFNWSLTAPDGDHLWNSRVDPGLKGRNGDEWHFPACAFAALPFQFWRGTMRFRFQIVASEYHKGRLRICYDPQLGGSSSEYNTHYTTIHDIAENKDFTVDVGWGQSVPYKTPLAWYSDVQYGPSPLITNIVNGNGVLSVYVLNKLASPSADVSDIQVNVFISMLDDFEVAAPNDAMSYVKFRPPISPTRLGSVPESGVEDDTDAQESPVADPEAIDEMASTHIDQPLTTKVFMGETIASFRTLLKRAYKSELLFFPEVSETAMVKFSRPSFPTYGGFSTATLPSGSMVTTFGDGRKYLATNTTLMNYLGRAFLGWRGSTRWTIDTSTVSLGARIGADDSDFWNSVSYVLSRRNFTDYKATVANTGAINLKNIPQTFNEVERGADMFGAFIGNTSVNPIQTIEVPYLKNDRFSYTFARENFATGDFTPSWNMSLIVPRSGSALDSTYLRFYVSAGEDFNFFFFNGLPPVYYEQSFALDQSV